MYAVSLLPREYQETRLATKRSKILLMASIIAIGALTIALIVLNLIGASLNQELEALKTTNEVMIQRIDTLRPVEVLMNDVTALSDQVIKVMGAHPKWESIIPKIGNALPPNVFLTSLTAGYAEDENVIVILGRAPDHITVSGTIEELTAVDGFGEVICSFSTTDSSSGNIQFELMIPLETGIKVQTEVSSK
jgi:Tfp pilus assembly protein PilN